MTASEFRRRYARALRDYLATPQEAQLLQAYELGREALAGDISVLEIAATHNAELCSLLAADPDRPAADLLAAAEPFCLESLSSFQMSQRSMLEANSILRRLNQMLDDEAGRIAHALHDDAGAILAAARMELDRAAGDLPDDVLQRVEQAKQLLDQTGEHLRHLSHELRPMVLDDLGLMPALNYLAEGIRNRNGIRVDIDGAVGRRPEGPLELAIYRAVQESLNNAVRHGGKVSEIHVRIREEGHRLTCVVSDDGCGFTPAGTRPAGKVAGMGLAAMREQLQAVGALLQIDSAPGRGTRVNIEVPLQPG